MSPPIPIGIDEWSRKMASGTKSVSDHEDRVLHFEKYQGLGNDFVILDLASEDRLGLDICRLVADRRFGVGCDQIMVILPPNADDLSDVHDARIRIYNANGSEAEACGNGTRSVVQYLALKWQRSQIALATKAGTLRGTFHGMSDVEVEQGRPHSRGEPLDLSNFGLPGVQGHPVDMGNPHLVIFLPTVDLDRIEKLGSALEHHPEFPNRTNVEFCTFDLAEKRARVWMWERGSGRTLACGSGACATAFVAINLYQIPGETRSVTIQMEGGTLQVSLDPTGMIRHRGAATRVFRGSFFLP